jgi:hypothetical protein
MCDESTDKRKKCCDCGCIGPQGPQGLIGMQGPQGPQGIPGTNGLQGPVGPQGPQGNSGVNGVAGPKGNDGSQGPIGPQGLPGMSGNPGIPGIQGPVGSIGPQGLVGAAGVQGLQGVPGLNGLQGSTGSVGPMGPAGSQGVQGVQGVPGQNCSCTTAYLSIFTLMDQTIPSLSSPSLEQTNITSGSSDFDISNASSTGEVKVMNHGVYLLSWAVDGKLTPPYPFPVPAWSFEIYRNGVGVVGTSSAAFSITPDDLVVHDSADAILEIFAGDVLKIVNTSTMSVNVVSNPVGSLITISSVRFNLNMVKPLP